MSCTLQQVGSIDQISGRVIIMFVYLHTLTRLTDTSMDNLLKSDLEEMKGNEKNCIRKDSSSCQALNR